MARAVEALVLELEAKGSVVDGRARRATEGYTNAVGRNTRAVRTGSRSQDAYARSMSTSSRSAGGLQRQLLGLAAAYISIHGAISLIRTTVGTFSSFESQMDSVLAVTRATDAEFQQLLATARELGATTRFSATEAGSGMEFLARAGFNAQEVISAMPGLLNLATAGAVDLGLAADIASNILSGFNLEASQTNRVADVMAETTAASNTNVQQLGDAMKFVAPIAAAMGVSVEEAAGAIGILSNAGLQGSMAGTGLRRVLSGLANPTGEAASAIQALGLTLEEVNPMTNRFSDVIQRLSDAGINAVDALTIFGDRGGPAILALTSAAPQVAELTRQIEGAEGAAGEMAATMGDNFSGSVKAAQSAMQEWTLVAGGEFMPTLRDLVDSITNWFRENDDLARRFGQTLRLGIQLLDDLAVAVGLLVGYKLAIWIHSATTAMLAFNTAVAANPLGLLVTGIAAAVVGLGALFDALDRADKQFSDVIELVNRAHNQPIMFSGTAEELEKSVEQTRSLVDELTRLRDSGKLTEGQLDHVNEAIGSLSRGLENYLDWKLKQEQAEGNVISQQIQALTLTEAMANAARSSSDAISQVVEAQNDRLEAIDAEIERLKLLNAEILKERRRRQEAAAELEEYAAQHRELALAAIEAAEIEIPEFPVPPLDEWGLADDQLIAMAETLDEMGVVDMDRINAQSERWLDKLFAVADAFSLISDTMGGILGQLVQGIERARQMAAIVQRQGGSSSAQVVGAAGGFLSGSNLFGGDGGNYGQEFSAVGSLFGPWGTAIGGLIGSFVKKGLDSATVKVTQDLTITSGDSSLLGPVAAAGAALRQTLQDLASSIGADVNTFDVSITQRGDKVVGFLLGVEVVYNSLAEAVSDMARRLATTEGVLTGASAEVQAALANTAATTMEQLQRDLAIALESRAQKVGDFQAAVESAVDEYFTLFEEELRLGLVNENGSGGITGLTRHFGELRDSILGIERSVEERMAQEREAFDLQVLMTRARLESMRAEILTSQATVNAEDAARRFQIESTSEWARHAIETSSAVSSAAAVAAQSAVAALAAIDSALNSDALRTITDEEFQDALDRINRGGGGGGRNRNRERLEQAARDLDRLNEILEQAGEIITQAGESSDIETTFRHLGERYAALFEEAADLAARKAEEEGITLRQALDEIFGTLGDAFGIETLELFRDEFARLQDAGDVEGIQNLIDLMNEISNDLPPELSDAFDSILDDWRDLLDQMQDEVNARDPRPLTDGVTGPQGADLDPRTRDRLEEELQDLIGQYEDTIGMTSVYSSSLAELHSDFDRMRSLTRLLTTDTDDLAQSLADLSRLEQQATQALGVDFLNSLNSLGAVSPELAAIQGQLAAHQLELARATAIADAIALAAAGAFVGLGISLSEIITAINSSVDLAISGGTNLGNTYNSTAQGADRLRSALDRVDDQIRQWQNIGVDPLQSTLDGMIDTFVTLRQEVLQAGGSVSDLTELEAALAQARERVWQEQLDRVRDFMANPEAAQAGLRREDQLGFLTGQFDQALAAVMANPSQGGIDSLLEAAEALRSFGLANFDGASLQGFLDLLNEQIAGVLDLELPDAEIPPVGEINTTVQQTLPQIAQGIQDALQLQQQTLLELLEQSPLLEQQLGITADQVHDISEMLGISAEQLAEFIEVNPNLATLIAGIGDNFNELQNLTGLQGEQLLEQLKLDPMLAELVGVTYDSRDTATQHLDAAVLHLDATLAQTDMQRAGFDAVAAAVSAVAAHASAQNTLTQQLKDSLEVQFDNLAQRLQDIDSTLDDLSDAVEELASSDTAGGT